MIDLIDLENELNRYYTDDLIINVNQNRPYEFNIYCCLLIGCCKDFEFNYIVEKESTSSYTIYSIRNIINENIIKLFKRGLK